MPMTELPLRSVGPEPAMMSATGTAPLAPRGTVSVAASPRSPLRMVYGDSIAAAGGTVSAFAGGAACPRSGGARTTSASATMSGLLMLLPPPQDVRLHDRHRDRQGRSGDEQHPRHRPGHECRRDHQHAGDHDREATVAMRLRHTVSLDSVHGVRIPTNHVGCTRASELPRTMKSSPTPTGMRRDIATGCPSPLTITSTCVPSRNSATALAINQ